MPSTTNVAKKKRIRRNHTPEFKASAVALAMQDDTTIAAVARDLGVSDKRRYESVASAEREARGSLSFDEREELQAPPREQATPTGARHCFKRGVHHVREGRRVNFEHVEAAAQKFPVAIVCDVLETSRSAFYEARARKRRGPSVRELDRRRLRHAIETTINENRGAYGRPRMRRPLAAKGIQVSVNRLRHEVASLGLYGKLRRSFKKTTLSEHRHATAKKLLKQNFHVDAPDRVWCGDITYVRTWQGWLYVAVVIDSFSRKVVGWAVADHMCTDLVTAAFDIAVARRNVEPGLISHSDRGSQYASNAMRRRQRCLGIKQSMSGRGKCYDNAVVESFNDKLKQELIHRHTWPTKAAAKLAIVEYIERFYNAKRIHSTLDYLSPNNLEDQHAAREDAA